MEVFLFKLIKLTSRMSSCLVTNYVDTHSTRFAKYRDRGIFWMGFGKNMAFNEFLTCFGLVLHIRSGFVKIKFNEAVNQKFDLTEE